MRLNATGERELASMRWGFAGKDDANPAKPKHMHARGETVDRLRTFAHAFAHNRGILMVHTFNEGEELPSGKTKQWVITPQDGQPIAIAVICEEWHNSPEVLQTFIQVTTPANALISRITDRMPAILPRDTWPSTRPHKIAARRNTRSLHDQGRDTTAPDRPSFQGLVPRVAFVRRWTGGDSARLLHHRQEAGNAWAMGVGPVCSSYA